MGECSRYYIVSLDPAMAGSVSVRVRIEHYCTPGDPPDLTAKRCADWRANVGPDWEPLDALYGVKCPPRGWIYYDGNYLAMPQPEVGHATLINAQIWAAVCHRPYPEGWPRPQ
jgi:hypothetical protein